MLRNQACVPCEVGAPTATEEEIKGYLGELSGWEVVEEEGMKRIKKVFKFKDFKEAVKFTDKVAARAEEHGHHPRLVLEWGKVEVWWWTHKIKGLHRNDFVMAAKTEEDYL